MASKNEKLKKLESELHDLEHWLQLGLVPKSDMEKHKEEMTGLQQKIKEEEERLRFLKESGELEEYIPPKRSGRLLFQDPQTLPDLDIVEEGLTDTGLDLETEAFDTETNLGELTEELEEEQTQVEEEEEDPFSDRNRWRRGILEDPDADNW